MSTETAAKKSPKAGLLKFVICSLLGIFLFLIPIPYGDSFSIVVGIISDFIKSFLGDAMLYIILVIVSVCGILSFIGSVFKPAFIMDRPKWKAAFVTSPVYLISRLFGMLVTVMVVFNFGPEAILSGDTGGTMVSLTKTLIAIIVTISYLMPLLTDFGIMEFTGVLIRKVVKPLFTLPGRSAIDLVTSWLGAANAAVLLTKRQYDTGFYSAREAAVIMTGFSLVSVPFCLLVAGTVDIVEYFVPMYLTVTIIGIILAAITPRIPPLSRIKDTYSAAGKQIAEDVPEDTGTFQYACQLATEHAEKTTVKDVINAGNDMLIGVIFNMTPVVIAWGTLALIIATYTPFFNWISYPMGLYLKLFKVEMAFEVAPATLVGFTDMFIPALLIANIPVIATRFIIAALSLVQIIYLTEVGIIAIQSDVPLNFVNLFIVFIERTLLAIPLLVLAAAIIF